MSGVTNIRSRLGPCLALIFLAALFWVSLGDSSQDKAGLAAIYALSLFISVGFILFGRERMASNGNQPAPED